MIPRLRTFRALSCVFGILGLAGLRRQIAKYVARSRRTQKEGHIAVTKESLEFSKAIAELIEMHESLMAHVFSIQTFLQDQGLLRPVPVDRRAGKFRKQFAKSRKKQLKRLEKKLSAERVRQLHQKILDSYKGPLQ